MVQQIVWSALAIDTYISNIEYLQKHWTQKEVEKFIAATERKLALLTTQPGIGAISNRRKDLRKTPIVKRVLLIYRHHQQASQIELVRFFNTWQHPQKKHGD